MATLVFSGNAQAIKQVTTCSLALTWATNDTATLTINGKDLIVIAASGTKSAIATQIVNAFNSSTIPEFAEITAAANGDTVVLTHDTAGVPFVVSLSSSTVGDGTFTATATTAAAGPNFFGLADNWVGGVAPTDADSVVLTNSSVSIFYDLDQSSLNLAGFTRTETYKGLIGLPSTNANGYPEYRPTTLTLSASDVDLRGNASRCRLHLLNAGTEPTTVNVDSGGQGENDLPAILLQTGVGDHTLNVTRGSVGCAFFAGESADFPTINLRYKTNQSSDAKLTLGGGCTLGDITMSGGTCSISSDFDSLSVSGGEATILDGVCGDIVASSGKIIYRTAGGYDSLLLGPGEVDFRQDPRSRTGTNTTLRKSFVLRDPDKTVTFTNPIDCQCDPCADGTLQLGSSLHLQRS